MPAIVKNVIACGSARSNRIITKYRRWLWQKIKEEDLAVMTELSYLKEQAITNDVNLLCFCKQTTREVACHGAIV